MMLANLQQWILHPETLNKDSLYELRVMLVRYPYCQLLRLLYLKNLYLLHDISFGAELRKSSLYVADRKILFYLIEGDMYALSLKKKKGKQDAAVEEAEGSDRTLSLINAFLSSASDDLSMPTELDYATDYVSILQKELDTEAPIEVTALAVDAEQQPKLRGQDLIDGFIEKADSEGSFRIQLLDSGEEETFEGPDLNQEEEDEADTFFTETLAQIYIKQKRYSKALEIIKKLSLKYPKKNGYFADQIRFLEKLIINANSK